VQANRIDAKAWGDGLERLKDDSMRQLTSTYPLRYTQRLLYSDMDALRHLNNGAIARFFEEGRAAANLRIFGGRDELRTGHPQTTVLARLVIEFLKEGRYPGQVEVCSGIASLGTTSIVHAHAAFQDGACLAVAEAVMVKSVEGRATPLSEREREMVGTLLIKSSGA
jgi:acyl-CoA thioester hydrolase